MTSPGQAPAGRYGGRSGLPGWAKVVIVLAVAAVVALLAVAGLFVWAFSGGWDGIRPAAEPSDRKVEAARARSSSELDSLTAKVLATTGDRELARVSWDDCEQGQNNWKMHDGYTLRCERTRAMVLVPQGPTVTAAAARLDAALVDAGWRPQSGRNEMAAAAEPNHSFLEGVRVGYYTRADDETALLSTRVTSRSGELGMDALPYDPDTKIEGDVEAFKAALASPGNEARGPQRPRLIVRVTVRYFDDS